MSGRTLMLGAIGGLAAGMLLAVPAAWHWGGLAWGKAHAWLLVATFLLPGLAALQDHLLERYLGLVPAPWDARTFLGLAWAAGLTMGLGYLFVVEPWSHLVRFVGAMLLLAAGAWRMFCVHQLLPRDSVVDVQRDPLTKGDDACLKQLRFAQYFLALGLMMLALAHGPGLDAWEGASRLRLGGLHLLLSGYALLLVYGLSHLVVPRLSKVPAIAAGAIKGELHSSLLGLLLLTAGFLSGLRGLVIAGGIFVFFGAFVFMGVLGANIMKNKSRTQRVTPEFAYVPWTFAGVFWLVAGLLLGVFLNAVPDLFADRLPALRFVHVHSVLLGGFAFLLMGYATRLVPAQRGTGLAIPFSRTKWSFYLLNLGLALMGIGHLQAGISSDTFRIGALSAVAGVAAWFMTLQPGAASR